MSDEQLRFGFGRNWSLFLRELTDDRVRAAETSLRSMLDVADLRGRSFLDIGSGSGLFSLAAKRLGAATVRSFDYDPDSVACTSELKRRYFPGDSTWHVDQGSILDPAYVSSLGSHDIVYSWGVLHHTGALWQALDAAVAPVGPGGTLFIAIYNDTGAQTERWRAIKKTYNRLAPALRVPFAVMVIAPGELKEVVRSIVRLRPSDYRRQWTEYHGLRGMSKWRDIVDWVGGYPYEAATADQIFDFYTARGFVLTKLHCGHVGLGCNEFVFRRVTAG